MKGSTTQDATGHDAVTDHTDHTAAQVAATFGCSRRKVTEEATRHGVGYNLGGRAGYRFTDLDVEKLRKAMAPAVAPTRRRSA